MSRDLVAVKDLKSWRPISRKSVKCVTILETSALIMNINMKLIFGIYMKNSYFFHISLNIGRSDMKQTAKNPVRSMLSYPFTLHSHTFFFFGVTIFWCYHCVWLGSITPRSIHQGPYTKLLGFKCPYTCLFLYRKKLQMSTFLVYLYKKKPLRALKHPYTSIHPYTKFCAQIPCSDSVLRFCATCAILTKLSIFLSIFHWLIFPLGHSALRYITSWAQRTVGDYLSCSAHCGGLPIVHSALWGIISRAQRTVGDYLSCTAHCGGLSLHFSRIVGDYLLFIY